MQESIDRHAEENLDYYYYDNDEEDLNNAADQKNSKKFDANVEKWTKTTAGEIGQISDYTPLKENIISSTNVS